MMARAKTNAEKRNRLMMEAKQTEANFTKKQQDFERVSRALKDLMVSLLKVKKDREEANRLYKEYRKQLKHFEGLVNTTAQAMDEAEEKYNEAWKTIVKFHQKKMSFAEMFEDVLGKLMNDAKEANSKIAAKKKGRENAKDSAVVKLHSFQGVSHTQK